MTIKKATTKKKSSPRRFRPSKKSKTSMSSVSEQDLQNQFNESDKAAALHNVIAGISREIHHPLKGLTDTSTKLIEKYKDIHFEYLGFKEFKELIKILCVMRDQSKYCLDTTDRLLSLYRRKHGVKNSYCDVNKVIHAAVQTLHHQMGVSGIKLHCKLAPRLPSMAIAAVEFDQVLMIILTNAVQSIPASGTIELKTRLKRDVDMIQIECRDNGVGMSKEILPHVFEPFFTTKHRGLEKSSGLGLSIVSNIVKSFRGKIQITSNPREGTQVRICLPVYKK